MKNTLLFLGLLFAGYYATAQSGNLWASAASGGCYGFGTILRGDANGNFATVGCFDSLNGDYPIGKMVMANGNLYGVTYFGTDQDSCCIFTFDTATNSITVVYSFFSDTLFGPTYQTLHGGQPLAGLTLATNGLIYGTTSDGGATESGVIYTVDPTTNVYTDVYDFTPTTGSNPATELIQALDGKLYGITLQGGVTDGPVLFSFDPVSKTYTPLYYYDLVYTSGNYSVTSVTAVSDLVQGSDGKLYGTLTYNTNGPLFGMLFSYDILTGTWTQLYGFNGATAQAPQGGITATGTKICGTLANSVFVYDISTGKTTLTAFTGNFSGGHPSSLGIMGDNKLVGCMAAGGIYDLGSIFIVDLNDNTSGVLNVTDIFDFDGTTTGKNPQGYILQTDVNATGIKPVASNSLQFYPNPAQNLLYVKNVRPGMPYTLTDILGQVVERGVFTAPQQPINVTTLPAGIYLLNNTRFVKE